MAVGPPAIWLSILQANGMTVVPHGRFYKIVDTGGVVSETTPIYDRAEPIPDTDRFLTRLYRLRSTSATEAANLLAKFKSKEGDIAGGVYMWETQADAEAFYTGPWRDGIRARYGNDPKIQYFETVALTDKASGKAGAV